MGGAFPCAVGCLAPSHYARAEWSAAGTGLVGCITALIVQMAMLRTSKLFFFYVSGNFAHRGGSAGQCLVVNAVRAERHGFLSETVRLHDVFLYHEGLINVIVYNGQFEHLDSL